MDVDIDADGKKEVFLTDPASWTKRGFLWQMYSPTGSEFDHLGAVTFNPGYIVVDSDHRALTVLEPVSIGVFDLVTYKVSDQLEETSRSRLEEPGDDDRIEEFRSRAETFTGERKPVHSWSAFVDGSFRAWVDLTTRAELKGLQPISAFQMSATEKSETLDLYRHLTQRLPCVWADSCEVFMLKMDVSVDGGDEILLRTSQANSDLGWMVYQRSGEGFVFLGALRFEKGWIRSDDSGAVVVLESDPSRLITYRVDGAGIAEVAQIDCSENPVGAIRSDSR